ncbi:MAG: hypothetical protein IJK31_11095 [Ruminococcus sp.]|nr:hypothetical protein [Ruminococcus sp.]
MSKIEEIENNIIKDGLTDSLFEDFVSQLKRTPKSNRQQHCYRTAIQIPRNRIEDSIRIINYGLENFETSWFDLYTSYLFSGKIYEDNNNYLKAYESYIMARSALGEEHPDYIPSITLNILWTKLHIDGFVFSESISELYNKSNKINSLEKDFITNEYKLLVAKLPILENQGKTEKMICTLKTALKMINGNRTSRLNILLSKHRMIDNLQTTPESEKYLKALSKKYKLD